MIYHGVYMLVSFNACYCYQMFPGEERYIIWPIQPHVVKDDITVKISAMSVIHKDEEEINIPIIVSDYYKLHI